MKIKKKGYSLTPEDQIYAKRLIKKFDKTIRRVIAAYLDPSLKYEAEDVVQNVYLMICQQLDDFRNYDSQEALVVTITTRAVKRLHRDWKDTVPLEDEYQAEDRDPGLDEILPSSLSPGDRSLLISVYQDRNTERELADDLGEEPATIRQRVKRARDRLRQALE